MNKAMLQLFSAVVKAPFGAVGVRTESDLLRELVYLPADAQEKAPVDALSEQAVQQIQRYFNDAEFRFELPLHAAGTAFQQRVWNVISSIPKGSVQTYGQVAKSLQSAPRAVGQACGANWFALVIPCHRVIGSGKIGGFANQDDTNGYHVGIKRWLLSHEGAKGWE